MRKSLAKAVAEVDRSLKSGDLLRAYDQAKSAMEAFPVEEALKHKALLALARAGATERAARLFREWRLDRSENADVLALEARLAKDHALKLAGEQRRKALLEAAALYKRVNDRKPRYYTAVNQATLTFLGGRRKAAAAIAKRVLADPEVAAADYWASATRAESNLLAGRIDLAAADLTAAGHLKSDDGAGSSTRRQLRLILAELGHSSAEVETLLAPLAPRLTVHYLDDGASGGGRGSFAEAPSAAARKEIAAALARLNPGAAFGSLGSPAEVLFAEAALKAGVELNVILPLPQEIFIRAFLNDAGKGWVRRFRACCENAARLEVVSEDPESEDSTLSDHAASVAMGLTLLRAQHLDGEAVQIVLGNSAGDGERGRSAAATVWTKDRTRRRVFVSLGAASGTQAGSSRPAPRRCCALVFGDVPGFSGLPDKYLPIFWDTVMKVIGEVVQANEGGLALRDTWGDAIHFVVPDVRNAAKICLAVQRRLSKLDGRQLGWKGPPTMRIGAHYGPVFEGWDPIAARHTYYGRALSRAARIEPITPPGTVYVTEAFAAILLLQSRGEFTCTYVGQVPLAKGFGTFRMYDLAQDRAVAEKR